MGKGTGVKRPNKYGDGSKKNNNKNNSNKQTKKQTNEKQKLRFFSVLKSGDRKGL